MNQNPPLIKSPYLSHTRRRRTAIGIDMTGNKEVLGLWIAQNEAAKFWLQVVTELKNRGVQDILIACVDGLKGFPEAIETVYPLAKVQLCIVHMVRHSLNYVSWKTRKEVAAALKSIYACALLWATRCEKCLMYRFISFCTTPLEPIKTGCTVNLSRVREWP